MCGSFVVHIPSALLSQAVRNDGGFPEMTLSFSTKALGALAGAALFAATMSAPASAFTLSSPSMSEHFAAGQVDKVYWCRWGRCGGYGYGWRRPYYGYGYGYPHRHCWWGPYGWRCRWW
jgi:hypothetical protein